MTCTLDIEVDALELPRGLITTRITLPVVENTLKLLYPKWIPGTHSPYGPVQNIGGLDFNLPNGKALVWQRDALDPYRFICEVPKDSNSVVVSLRYICNQPSVNSRGIDSYGYSLLGIINWNTCILYPEGIQKDEIIVNASLKIPCSWKYASALESQCSQNEIIEFEPSTLTRFIDSPVICGKYLGTTAINVKDFPEHYIHVVSEFKSATQLKAEFIEKFYNLVAEAKNLFSVAHYKKYHFLVVLSDTIPNIGLEHFDSSLNALNENAFSDRWQLKGRSSYLLPHEFVHSWCGKYRLPIGMHTKDYNTAMDTRLLWV